MEGLEDGEKGGKRVRLVWVRRRGAFIEEGYAEVKVREGERC